MVRQVTEVKTFIEAIEANPDDDAPVLIYADWLEENGFELWAKIVRFCCKNYEGNEDIYLIYGQNDLKIPDDSIGNFGNVFIDEIVRNSEIPSAIVVHFFDGLRWYAVRLKRGIIISRIVNYDPNRNLFKQYRHIYLKSLSVH